MTIKNTLAGPRTRREILKGASVLGGGILAIWTTEVQNTTVSDNIGGQIDNHW